MRREFIVVDKGRGGIALAILAIGNGHWLYLRGSVYGTAHQPAMKGAHLIPCRGGTLGKNHQAATLLKCAGQLALQGTAAGLATLDEQGAGGTRQPADHWPVTHFRLG